MRKVTVLFILLLALAGCASDPSSDSAQNLTIFGRLSQLVQLGSTEETIAYKLQTDDLFVTIRGEVLVNRPGELSIFVTDRTTGLPRTDYSIAVSLCHAVDEDVWAIDACGEHDGELYQHTLNAELADGQYTVGPFEWQREGGWSGTLILEGVNSADMQTLIFDTEVYPARPPSSNAFELTNITLPFIVIALFLAVLRLRKGELMQSIGNVQLSTD